MCSEVILLWGVASEEPPLCHSAGVARDSLVFIPGKADPQETRLRGAPASGEGEDTSPGDGWE